MVGSIFAWRCRLQCEGLAWCRDTGTAWIVMDLIGAFAEGVAAYVISLRCTSLGIHVITRGVHVDQSNSHVTCYPND